MDDRFYRPDVLTNILDALSFILITPQVAGPERMAAFGRWMDALFHVPNQFLVEHRTWVARLAVFLAIFIYGSLAVGLILLIISLIFFPRFHIDAVATMRASGEISRIAGAIMMPALIVRWIADRSVEDTFRRNALRWGIASFFLARFIAIYVGWTASR